MIQGIRQRRKACAAALMWRTIPFARSTKNHFHRFLDLSLQVTELLEAVDSLHDSVEATGAQRTREVLNRIIKHVQKLKKWEEEARIPLMHGPLDSAWGGGSLPPQKQPPNPAFFKGHSSKIPADLPVTFDGIQNARIIRLYWTVLLTLYMAILDDDNLRCELKALQGTTVPSGEPDLFVDGRPARPSVTITSLRTEGNQLADNIAVYSGLCCQNLWQSFGTMLSTFTLETAVRWYQRHHSSLADPDQGTGSPDENNNPHLVYCQILLGAIATQQRTQRPGGSQLVEDYQNATFGDVDVLRLPWCDRFIRSQGHYLSPRDRETAAYLERHPQGFAYVEPERVAG